MSTQDTPTPGRHRRRSALSLLLAVVVLAILGWVLMVFLRAPRGPKLLNEPTEAREVRPFTPEPDPRFDPLPLEREKHAK